VGPDSAWDEVVRLLGPPLGGPVVQRDGAVGRACGESLVYGYPGLVVETTRFGGLATVTLYGT
jgi:hypothetical protein